MNKSEKITIISTIILVGFFIGIVVHYVFGMYLNLGFPFNTFLFEPKMHFGDFYETMPKYPLAPYAGCYFPLAYIILAPFSIFKNKLAVYVLLVILFIGFVLFENIKHLSCKNLKSYQNFQNIFILTFLAYPILFLLDRGNFDMVLFPILFFAIYFFKNESYIKSALLFAVENAIKPFTLLFLFLFLFKKKYKEFFISLFTSLFFIVWGFIILKGNVFSQVSVFIKSLANFNGVYVYMPKYALTNTSSVFTALKLLLCSENKLISIPVLMFYYKIFSLIASCIILLAVFFEKTFWKKITLLTLSFCMLPTIIYDYKLVFLLIPLWLFVNSDKKSRFDIFYSILFGLLLIPKQFFILIRTFSTGTEMATYGCVVNPILMLIFTSLIIYECIMEFRHV